jgi:hypothetical protein
MREKNSNLNDSKKKRWVKFFPKPQIEIFELPKHHLPVRIQSCQDKQHNTESEQGSSSVTDKRKGNTNYRCETDSHAHVDRNVEEENRSYAIGIA